MLMSNVTSRPAGEKEKHYVNTNKLRTVFLVKIPLLVQKDFDRYSPSTTPPLDKTEVNN